MFIIRAKRAFGCFAVLVGSALLISPAVADTSGSVSLSGAVTSTLAITASATAGATLLDLDGDGAAGQHIVKVADLAISTNNEQGYELTASSGNLTKVNGTSIAYQVTSVVDADPTPESGDFTVASGSNYVVTTGAAGAANKDLYIMYTPAALQDPGTYTGTISLTVADR